MKKNWLGLIFLIASIITSLQNINLTGAITDNNNSYYLEIASLIFLITGIIILATKTNENYTEPEHLYAFVPKECLETGIKTGGWLKTPITPGFDPNQIPIERVQKSFGGPEKILVEILNPYKKEFKPRATGPDRGYHGIYASHNGVPKDGIEKVA